MGFTAINTKEELHVVGVIVYTLWQPKNNNKKGEYGD